MLDSWWQLAGGLLCTVLLSVFVSTAHADVLGDTLKPFVSVTEMYDSNIFRIRDKEQLKALVGDDRLGDFLTVTTVGTEVKYRVSRQQLDLHLQHDFIRFSHYDEQDVGRDEYSGKVSLSLLDALRVTLDGEYLRSPASRLDYSSAGVNKRTDLTGGIASRYEMTSGVVIEGAYRRSSVDYSLPQYRPNQYVVDRYAGTVSYRISPDCRTYASYHRDETRHEVDLVIDNLPVKNSNSADSFLLGIDKAFGARSKISCYVGYLNRRYNASSTRDFSGVIGKAALTYEVTARLRLMLGWERQLYEETYIDRIYSINNVVNAALRYQISNKVTGSVSTTTKWKIFADVPGSGAPYRMDRIHELATGIDWSPVSRLAVGIGYQYSRRFSDDETFEFTDHQLMSHIAYRF